MSPHHCKPPLNSSNVHTGIYNNHDNYDIVLPQKPNMDKYLRHISLILKRASVAESKNCSCLVVMPSMDYGDEVAKCSTVILLEQSSQQWENEGKNTDFIPLLG